MGQAAGVTLDRYLLFGGDEFYPAGGWDDFLGDFMEVSHAQTFLALTGGEQWAEIVDTEAGRIVTRWYHGVGREGKWTAPDEGTIQS